MATGLLQPVMHEDGLFLADGGAAAGSSATPARGLDDALCAAAAPAAGRGSNPLTAEQQAQLRWVREGYIAALRALNQGCAPAHPPSAPESVAELLAHLSSETALQRGSAKAPADNFCLTEAGGQEGQLHAAPLLHVAESGCAKKVHAGRADQIAQRHVSAMPIRPCRSAAEAQKVWAGFAKQQDAISFAAACNAAAVAETLQPQVRYFELWQ